MKPRREIVLQRVDTLFVYAKENALARPERAQRAIEIARVVCRKARVRLPRVYRRLFCKNCNAYFIAGKNCRVRVKQKVLTIACKQCKQITRLGTGA